MSADTPRSLRMRNLGTLRTVTALVASCALTQFAIQAWLSYSFASQVWRIPALLCFAVIAALDLFVTTFMFLTYLLRSASFAVRAYAWIVLAGGIAAQLYAAELFAQHEQWSYPVRGFAALPALFLAASLHGLIKYRQHATATDGQGREAVEPVAAPRQLSRSAAFQAIQAVAARVPTEPVPAAKPKPRTVRAQRADDRRELAVKMFVEDGKSPREIAAELGVSRRAVENWTKPYRTQRDTGSAELQGAAIAADGAQSPKESGPDNAQLHTPLAPDVVVKRTAS
jgi:transposase-like protein